MPKAPAHIRDLFHTPSRFLRSVQLERDFQDPHAIDGYIVTEPMALAFRRVIDGLRPTSGQRAWRITGDYGVGKSSFALVLAHLLRGQVGRAISSIAEAIDWPRGSKAPRQLWPILITGSRSGAVQTIATGIAEACQPWPKGTIPRQTLGRIREQALQVAKSGDVGALEALINTVRQKAAANNLGVLIVLDELGKILEHAALRSETEDIFVLQRLAELASRSGEQPFIFVALLHQAFQAYADRLPAAVRQEWDKVAGRFEEITFDQPLVHTAALVSGALGVKTGQLPRSIVRTARAAAEATATIGWLSGGTASALTLDASPLYPIHPTMLPALVRFFARFGQHERSLFGFLLSNEPMALQSFAEGRLSDARWYDLAEFYDYIRSSYGHRLGGDSYRSHWLRISALVSAAEGLSSQEQRVLKTIAVLNLIDAEDLLPTERAIIACLVPSAESDVSSALRDLSTRGLLHKRGSNGGYRLWPATSLNLTSALSVATRELQSLDRVATHLQPHLSQEPVLARRHYLKTGTMRFFEVRYATADTLPAAADKPTPADGLVVVALCDSRADREAALTAAAAAPLKRRADVLVGVSQPLMGLRSELIDLKRWEWIQQHTPELPHDPYASAEVSRQLAAAKRVLTARVRELAGLRERRPQGMVWIRSGRLAEFTHELTTELSHICDELFAKSPLVRNELLNRNALSSAAAAARMRLIERIFANSGDPELGMDTTKAPPERSMYLSVLRRGGLHLVGRRGPQLQEPTEKNDPLRLRPAFAAIHETLDAAHGARVRVPTIFTKLKAPPLGVRDGLAPLLLALVLKTRAHDLAVYEDGTFLYGFGAVEFLRLTKTPAAFEIQHCHVQGVRAEVFSQLAATFASRSKPSRGDIMEVVVPLCQFAAGLPEYVRRTAAVSPVGRAVRDALLAAREPATLLFTDLPTACGHPPFAIDEHIRKPRVAAFVTALQGAVEELKGAYPKLIDRLVTRISDAMGQRAGAFDRSYLAQRAAKVTLAAREQRLRAFAMRLRDPGTSDESWAEAIASMITARPPRKWGDSDEAQFSAEISTLAEIFHRVEATAFDQDSDRPVAGAIRLNLTRADGEDVVRILHPDPLARADARKLDALRQNLPLDRTLRLQFLTELLWRELRETGAASDLSLMETS